MPAIKLYYAPGACSLASHIILRETGLKFDVETMKEGQDLAIFVEGLSGLNSKKQVPVLVLGQETITEVTAIMTASKRFCILYPNT